MVPSHTCDSTHTWPLLHMCVNHFVINYIPNMNWSVTQRGVSNIADCTSWKGNKLDQWTVINGMVKLSGPVSKSRPHPLCWLLTHWLLLCYSNSLLISVFLLSLSLSPPTLTVGQHWSDISYYQTHRTEFRRIYPSSSKPIKTLILLATGHFTTDEHCG